jgi:uncharacterized protein
MTAIFPSFARSAALLLLPFCRRLRSLHLIACVLIGACAVSSAAACPLQAPSSRVTDLAGLLGEHANKIAGRLAAYQQASGHRLVVLIVPSLDAGMSIEQCAVAVFQNWKIGRKGIDDGALLLVAVKERKMRIEVGYGLEDVLTDAQSSRIIHEVMQPLFARGEFAEGIDRGLVAIISVIGSPRPAQRAEPELSHADDAHGEMVGKFIVVGLGLMVLLLSTTAGIVGLLAFGIPIAGLVYFSYQDWRGYLFACVYGMVWCAVRWRMICSNVKKYHLKKSRNKTLTWIRCFVASGFAGPERKRKARAAKTSSASSEDGFSFSFSSSGDNGGNSGDSSSDGDTGGASGGGGASGNW